MTWKNSEKLKCSSCKSTRLRKDGIVAGKQRYYCKVCGKTTIIPYGKRRVKSKKGD